MIEGIKGWVNTILCLGIFFTIVRMIIPNTALKKYISSLIGIITIIVVASPTIKIFQGNSLEGNIKDILLNVTTIETMSTGYTDLSNYEDINKNNVKERFKISVQEDMKEKLKTQINIDVEVTIDITNNYNIEKVNVKVPKEIEFDVEKFLYEEYDIDYKKIKVTKE